MFQEENPSINHHSNRALPASFVLHGKKQCLYNQPPPKKFTKNLTPQAQLLTAQFPSVPHESSMASKSVGNRPQSHYSPPKTT